MSNEFHIRLPEKSEYEIVERPSGYWIVNGKGYVEGPYATRFQASKDVPREGYSTTNRATKE